MEKKRLGDICEIVTGATPKTNIKEFWDGDINWITPAELTEDTYIINESLRKITTEGVEKTGLKSFPKGTVILSSRAPIGKVAIAGYEMYCNQGFKNLICSKQINNRFLYWYLKGHKEYLNSLGRGATFKEISKAIVENIEICLPTLEKQEKYADILEQCNGIIQIKKGQLRKLETLVKSRFVEMFGDMALNQKHWDKVKIGSIVKSIESGWSGNGKQRKKRDGEIAVLKVSSVTKGYFIPEEYKVLDDQNNIKKYIFPQKGDLIFSRANTREMVGATAIIRQDYPELILPDKLWKIQFLKYVDVVYIKYALSTSAIRKEFSNVSTGTSGSMYNVSMEKFKNIDILLPPIELQNQFADFVASIDKSKSKIQKSLEETQLLFDSLMQKYFG